MYGGPEETRTLDLSDANRTLSQLSYRPKYSFSRLIITHSFENATTFFFLRLFKAVKVRFSFPPCTFACGTELAPATDVQRA